MRTLFPAPHSLRLVAMSLAGSALLLHAGISSAGCASGLIGSALSSGVGPAAEKMAVHPRDADAAKPVPVSSEQRFGGFGAGIVGLWKFEMISKNTPDHVNPMSDGTLVDFGTAAWHADHTELQLSGFRNPADGDVCQGVWKPVDDNTYVLNHYALAWQNGSYAGPANIRAEVSLNHQGDRYSGLFVTTVYAATPTIGHEFDETTPLVTITGTFKATRVDIGN